MKRCACDLKELDAALKPKGYALDLATYVDNGIQRPQIKVRRIDHGRRRTNEVLIPTFCPFCGRRYSELPPKKG